MFSTCAEILESQPAHEIHGSGIGRKIRIAEKRDAFGTLTVQQTSECASNIEANATNMSLVQRELANVRTTMRSTSLLVDKGTFTITPSAFWVTLTEEPSIIEWASNTLL